MPEDPAYSDTETEVEDELDCFLQAVEMVLTTRRGEVLGEPSFGANLEDFLWNTGLSESQVETAVRSQIESYCSDYGIPYGVLVSFFREQVSDSMLVDITIDGTKVLGIAVRS